MKKRFAPGCTLLLAIAALVFTVGPASAAKKTSGLACGDYVSGSVALTKNLKCSSGDGLNVNADGTTIDLAGYSIFCTGSCDTGIYDDEYDNVTIKDSGKKGKPSKKGQIVSFFYGVYLDDGVQHTTVNGLQIFDVAEGIRIDNVGFSNSLTNNTIAFAGAGVDLDLSGSGGGNTISGNSVFEAECAFCNNNNSSNGHNLWSNNSAAGVGVGYYDYQGFFDTWQNNMAAFTTWGFEGDHTCSGTWNGNTSKFAFNDGFDIWNDHNECANVTVTNNTATKTEDGPGFYFEKLNFGSDGSTISGNTSSKNAGPGFREYRNYYSNLTGNTAMKNGWEGFYLDHTFEETITGNTATGNGVSGGAAGFYVNNNFSPNGCDGGNQCQVNDLSGNTANTNSFFGLFADQLISGAPNGASGNGTGQCFNVACTPSLAPVHPAGPYARANLATPTHGTRYVGKDG